VVPVSAALAAAPSASEGGLGGEGEGEGEAALVRATAGAGGSSPLVTVAGFVDEVTLLVSLQRPKRLVLLGSDGRPYAFLAKPKDDLRKDARMMEVAGVANALFAREPAASRRGLRLRRFAVQPLTEDCGLVEWVSHTATLRTCCQDVLEGHGMYSGRSTNPMIKAWYDEATGPGAPSGAASAARRKVEWLERVLGALPPRLHAWYATTFRDPAAWHAARLALARGAAAWSVVGHVVGLGDRHGENMLLCGRGGEVVHVDFSCLFDKGLTLEKPEVVPFRLTQNIVDAFGVAGVEGAFRPAAEATLAALRAHRETLLSVLETFVHDPLVEWSRGAAAAAALAVGGSVGGRQAAAAAAAAEADNPQAQDAMATMRGRLTGTLLGVRSTPCLPLAVPGQVARLIDEATDRGNLADMYIWWMAWF
jgi:serine/threonine-protein kinase ATR